MSRLLDAVAPEAAVPARAGLVARDLTLGYTQESRAARARGVAPGSAPPVVEAVNLALAPGERIALVGASGSGKTTLLQGLAGLLRPLAGEVMVDGTVVASPIVPGTSRHAAYMFQRDLLLPWRTARDNAALVAIAARPRPAGWEGGRPGVLMREKAEALLMEFGLGDALDVYPRQLSGGMRRRVALARTLVLGRRLVLLDEPFAGLDSLTRSDLQDWLRGVMTRHLATWIIVTHDIREAVALAERVAVLGGRPAGIVGWVEVRGDQDEAIDRVEGMLRAARG